MTESVADEVVTKDLWVEDTYNHWLGQSGLTGTRAKRYALSQTLHKASLMEIEDWDKDTTPKEIADFILKTVPEEADWWLTTRHGMRPMEQDRHDPAYRRVFRVIYELTHIMREKEEKENTKPLVEAGSPQSEKTTPAG